MSLSEGVQARVAYKAYSTGVITSNTQPTSFSDPGASGGQILRRVSSTLKFGKDTYTSNEVRTDYQIEDLRHGTRRVTGNVVDGELSPGTYWDFFEAALRTTAAAAVSLSQSDLTSVSADESSSTFIFGGGDPVTLGLRIGSIIRFTNLAETANNATNFLVLGFGGSSHRTVTVSPAPTTMTADSGFDVAEIGQSLYMPSTGFVKRKFAIEHYFADVDVARLFTEVRIDGFNVQLPATGLATASFPGMGRDVEHYNGSEAPFFSAPTAAGSTGIFAAVNGLLRAGGVDVGVVTGLTMQGQLSGSGDPVVGQDILPEIFQGRLNITGQASVMFQDATFLDYFLNETEISILAYLTSTTAANAPAMSIYLPRVKFSDADLPVQGEGAQTITMPFQALKGAGTTAGEDATVIRLQDTEAS